jgi:predicted kinase
VVSLDAINAERGLWGGDGIPIAEWERSHGEAVERMRALVTAGRDVVVDDTNSPKFIRERYRVAAAACGAVVSLVYIPLSDEEMIRRVESATRAANRPLLEPRVLADHVAAFEPPDEKEAPVVLADEDSRDVWLASIAGSSTSPETRSHPKR